MMEAQRKPNPIFGGLQPIFENQPNPTGRPFLSWLLPGPPRGLPWPLAGQFPLAV